MNTKEMTLDEKKEALYDWIRNLDEEALNQLKNYIKTQNKNNITYNGWVYEKVCLDELSNYRQC